MKRTFAKHIKQSLAVMSLVLGVFLFSATSAAAQSGAGAIGADLNWKASADAQQVLMATVQQLHNDPQVTVVGSQSYIQVNYFKEIFHHIDDGSSTWEASRSSLSIFSGSGQFATQTNPTGVVLNDTQKQALFQVAVGLLTD